MTRFPLSVLAVAVLLSIDCDRRAPTAPPVPDAAAGLVPVAVRVPAALTVARAIDTLSVAVDPEMLGLTPLMTTSGRSTGVEAHVLVFPRGQTRAVAERRAVGPGMDFNVGATTWHVERDGIPVPDIKYVVEMEIVVFETDVAPSRGWDPHAGQYRAIWTRTLRQAEE